MTAYAHTIPDGRGGTDRDRSKWQPLEEHLRNVGAVARNALEHCGLGDIAQRIGERHDLGKYSCAFQQRLADLAAEGEEDASNDGHAAGRVDHATAAALQALLPHFERDERRAMTMPIAQLAVAFCVAFHHGGLRDREDLRQRLAVQLERKRSGQTTLLDDAIAGGVPQEFITDAPLSLPDAFRAPDAPTWMRRFEFAIRMLYSALLDADFIDTERHMNPAQSAARLDVPQDAIPRLRATLDAFLDRKSTNAPATEVNRVRREVLTACRTAAERAPGLFTLTAPTGGGKTLSSLAFALRHAERHGLSRVIVVIPYTSIIDQTAEVYREWLRESGLDDCWLIEHHSALDPARETKVNRLAAENWDAPLIITTSVQLFESLHARKSSAVRKLHRISRSVVVLDEVQTLPPALLQPCLDALAHLVRECSTSVVLCTATQPALLADLRKPGGVEHLDGLVSMIGRDAIEIDPQHQQHATVLNRRVSFSWRDAEQPLTWDELAARVREKSQALVIVNTRKDARTLYERLRPSAPHANHLSALMCGRHRRDVLARARAALCAKQPCLLVTTQLIEAGVDVDFPIVYRAVAGLDSIAQAAGRCNREGTLDRPGPVFVFEPAEGHKRPPTVKLAGDVVAGWLAEGRTPSLDDPSAISHFFTEFYERQSSDEPSIRKLRQELAFEQVARGFKLVDDEFTDAVAVPYGECEAAISRLTDRSRRPRDRLRALQPYLVNVPTYAVRRLRAVGAIEEAEFGVLRCRTDFCVGSGDPLYDSALGLRIDAEAQRDPATLIA